MFGGLGVWGFRVLGFGGLGFRVLPGTLITYSFMGSTY